ncbi:hypothetical protein ACI2S3_07875 [Ralstonia nicotianae]|uniref:hypothetical protein n=1 Tax=Ralstonia pseudosolanacearum TaxID=1310165 RepID=UPI00048CA666|nr:hypothetical protein [Ralstonia pseudosolanacearum]AXW38294.1 hypothetical protein CJO89_08245 [Ralstonia solanacearum]AXW71144.1 hypothetical protein CJO96_08240 [Ralstonia solanacearum]MDO3508487.1 hypothetical protein [Ralstonia pseudosolanacearum]MDO3513669.1 hypothetical protein [Ralstonia pseudosolanacearum]MDO3523763.1 hypothetical protein [Ralstonia pseudosolanacearum]
MSREALARRSLIVLAALILLFEEWIWNAMLRATARLVAHPWVQAAERRMAELEPIEALCAFMLPMLALLPFKLAAVYMLARGHFLGGAAVLALAKVVSTTLGARIYVVVRPQLQQISWYVRLESRFLNWKHRVVAALRATPTWQALQARLAAWRVQRHGLLRQGWRRLVAVLRLMRRHRTVNPPH